MTKSKLLLTSLLLLGSILTSPIGFAQSEYAATGKILAISNSVLNLSDLQVKLSPTVKVRLEKGVEGELGDLEIGDLVGIRMITIGKKSLVDSIHILSELTANEGDSFLPGN